MNYADERYVRVYTRDTVGLLALSWQARAVLWEALRKADRSGVIEVGDHGAAGLAGLLRMPLDVVEPALAELVRGGQLVTASGRVTLPRYVEAQECRQSDRRRQEESRSKRRADSMGLSQNVTDCHQRSHAVTNGHSVPSVPSVPSRAVPGVQGGEAPTPDPSPAARPPKAPRTKPRSSCPSSVDPEAPSWLDARGVPPMSQTAEGAEVRKFLDHHRGKGSVMADWAATWRTWRANAVRYGTLPALAVVVPPRPAATPDSEAAIEAMMAAERAKRWGTG